MLNKSFKAFIFTGAFHIMGCGTADANCIKPTARKTWYPQNAYYINAIDGGFHQTVENTIFDLELRTGEPFMHAEAGKDLDIKILYGDLENAVIGQAETWSRYCRITMSNRVNPDSPSYEGWGNKDFAAILRHEIGHCFGMEHSEDPNSIMYWQYHPVIHPGERAINNFVNDLKSFRDSHK